MGDSATSPAGRAARAERPLGHTGGVPELPEVESLVELLRQRAVDRVVARVDVVAVSALKTFDPPPSALAGLTVEAVQRRGKYLDLRIGGLSLVVHLARAGWLQWREAVPVAPPGPGRGPLALRVSLDDGSGFDLTEAGTQKRLAVWLVGSAEEVPGVARLGVDPLDPEFTAERLAALLHGSRSQVKGALSDQSLIAGVGNAYSDEALWAAGLSPYKPAGNLTAGEVERLHAALTGTLTSALTRSLGLGASSLKSEKRSGMNVHGRTGQACPRCGDTVREVSFADKSLQYCPTCQTGGKPLADRRLSRLLR
jgi:formamidopyrimidine-DNA glycosylase